MLECPSYATIKQDVRTLYTIRSTGSGSLDCVEALQCYTRLCALWACGCHVTAESERVDLNFIPLRTIPCAAHAEIFEELVYPRRRVAVPAQGAARCTP